jgi:trehalose 6-phosphate synthase/phosphatase
VLTESQSSTWKDEVRPVFRMFQDRVPGSLIEEKSHSLAWHYRTVKSETGISQARELFSILTQMAANLEISVFHGNRVIEIKNVGMSKGRAALGLLQKGDYDFVLAIGDDLTDETMFRALPPQAHSIKVGPASSYAKYNFRGQPEVRPFLEGLAGATGAAGKRKKKKKGDIPKGPGPKGRTGKGG